MKGTLQLNALPKQGTFLVMGEARFTVPVSHGRTTVLGAALMLLLPLSIRKKKLTLEWWNHACMKSSLKKIKVLGHRTSQWQSQYLISGCFVSSLQHQICTLDPKPGISFPLLSSGPFTDAFLKRPLFTSSLLGEREREGFLLSKDIHLTKDTHLKERAILKTQEMSG